ncbi:MAG: PaaI family thioesterase [Selenomonadaceae bacterium]|nr:PaaI family thioesterase [Selenomonadaceae bacterium]
MLLKPTQEQIIKFYHENTVIDFLEIEVVPTLDGEARLELCADSRHANLYSMAHGGVLTIMADTAMGAKCLAFNKKVVTISLNIEFMHAVMTNTPRIFTNATVLHDGRKTMVCECKILDAKGKLYAKATATFFVVGHLLEES